jgi:hypothetical protein
MADTHIHIHLDGGEAAATPTKARRRAKPKASSPTKPKRKASAYSKTVGREMKRLKKAGFRGNVMKKAHSIAKKKHKK